MPLEVIMKRTLQVTVWNHDSLQENEFLGGVEILLAEFNIKEECGEWYRLGYLPRQT
jgi:phosphatidylinositol-4-phosphate 3-kinase